MNIIITGASAGIGYETALRFSERDENVVFALARRPDNLKALEAAMIRSTIVPVVSDLGSYNYESLLSEFTLRKIKSIDIVIHNAGLLINKPFQELTPEEWEEVYRVNVIAPAQLTRQLLPFMGGENHTHIVTIGSMGGVRGSLKFPGLSAYSSSKGALGILTECLAEEFRGRNITVNCLALGSVQTEMLTKAFPGYAASMQTPEVSRLIYDFAVTGWRYFNGKILEVSTANP